MMRGVSAVTSIDGQDLDQSGSEREGICPSLQSCSTHTLLLARLYTLSEEEEASSTQSNSCTTLYEWLRLHNPACRQKAGRPDQSRDRVMRASLSLSLCFTSDLSTRTYFSCRCCWYFRCYRSRPPGPKNQRLTSFPTKNKRRKKRIFLKGIFKNVYQNSLLMRMR